ncbi:MAG: hypothetical protein K2H45_13055 [Acetatifactor sp.]|nr:hypothetical protein [Acetatifactor sp.]
MGEDREISKNEVRVKKLALAFKTGWEYMPGSEEAGSVLTDIFLRMADANRRRFERIWEKQELVFLQAVPESREEPEEGRGALLIKVSGEENGNWLEEGTRVYLPRQQGEEFSFRTVCPVQLTSAKLRYAVYRRGLWAWLSYEEETDGQAPLALFQPVGVQLAHPVFRWYFQGLCDGREDFGFAVDFGGAAVPHTALSGTWTVSDGDRVFPAEWQQSSAGFSLRGECPAFAGNLSGGMYQVCLFLSPGQELTEEWLKALCGDFILTREAEEREPDLCLTESGAGDGETVYPFGASLEEASCVYLACDRVMAGEGQEIVLRFRERFVEEEKSPAPVSPEYQKLYKKYPWLNREQPLLQWQAQETLWEYFNGNMWRILPGSETWRTGCGPEAGERSYRWKRPRDMQPCAVEGEEHFYIRLRLNRVSNAYAACYRKRIPVWEEIRFSVEKRSFSFCQRDVPKEHQDGEEKMYLGFDREITPGSCWYTGEDFRSFEREQIRGEAQIFGKQAFWVELPEKKEETLSCLLPNYVPVRHSPEETEEQREAGIRIEKGTEFYVEPRNMGILEAVCLEDICLGSMEAPSQQEKPSAEHYLTHFGRVLTSMDLELMLQERYPLLRLSACTFQRKDRRLEVALAFSAQGRNRKALMTAGEAREEMQNRLPEIREWLEAVVSKKAPLWLQDCRVEVKLKQGTGGT